MLGSKGSFISRAIAVATTIRISRSAAGLPLGEC